MTDVNAQVKKVVEDEIWGNVLYLNPSLRIRHESIFWRLDLAWVFFLF